MGGTMEEEIPHEVGRGRVHIAPGLEIEAALLSNGQTVVTEETMIQFFEWLGMAPSWEEPPCK